MQWSRAFRTALFSLTGIGPATYRRCLKTLKDAEVTEEDFWVNKHWLWQKIHLEEKTIKSIKKFKKEHTPSSYFTSLFEENIRVIFPEDKEFPPLLTNIENAPPLLFARGRQLARDHSYLSVVGTRKMTSYGKRVIQEMIPPLVQYGKTIVSGFMYGVDLAAQRAALQESGGTTVGILGFGFDHMYPPEQQPLFDLFLERGATFLSPFAPHVSAVRGNFPARNAVVAGMSEGVLVVEAAEKSGSLITAGYAADFGREVWAVPGSVFSEFSQGTKELINQGASLVNNAEDILGLTGQTAHQRQQLWRTFRGKKRKICRLLTTHAFTTDELAEKLTTTVPLLTQSLTELELLGAIEQAGNQWQLAVS